MRREWGATGVGKYFPPRLSHARRKQIVDELRRSDFRLRDPEPLLDDLAAAVGGYDSSRHMREKSRPAAVRENLKAALKPVERLNERINALDGNSWLLIREAANVDKLSLHNNLDPLFQALVAALQLARQYPDKGNLPGNERVYLAADVLDALEKHLGESSRKVLGRGCFEAILKVVLEEALRQWKDVESITGSLADQVLSNKVKIKHPDGVVEYRRPQRC